MDATTAVAQTLTCNIGDVTQAVDVSWKKSDESDVVNGQDGYTVVTGSVVGTVQKSTLEIEADTLRALPDTSSPLTWKCAAKSTQYPDDSEKSSDQDVVVTFHDYGKNLQSVKLGLIHCMSHFSRITRSSERLFHQRCRSIIP